MSVKQTTSSFDVYLILVTEADIWIIETLMCIDVKVTGFISSDVGPILATGFK